MPAAFSSLIVTLFLTARGPGYLALALALVVIFGLEWIVKVIAFLTDRYERKRRKRRP